MNTQKLSFRLRIARTESDLAAACRVRADSYGRHVPGLRDPLSVPDALDRASGVAVFVCVDKASGEAIGTARVQAGGEGRLLIEGSVSLPDEFASAQRAEITRLSVRAGADPLAKLALVKAAYLYCVAAQVGWIVIGARSESLIRQYARLGFRDVFADRRMVPLVHAGLMPHRILAVNVTAAERTWQASGHPMYDFMVGTFHPDISLLSLAPALSVDAAETEPALLAA